MEGKPAETRAWWMVPLLVLTSLSAGAQAEPAAQVTAARDAVGLLIDNQDRCVKLAYGKLDILDSEFDSSRERSAELGHYLENQNPTSVRVAKKALEIVQNLRQSFRGDFTSGMNELTSTQNDLCAKATHRNFLNSADDFRAQILELENRFDFALSSLPADLQLDSAARRKIVLKYRDQLYGSPSDPSEEATARAVAEDRGLLTEDSIDAREYARKQKEYDEWLAEQERREAEKVRRQAQRRAAIQERQKQPREMPKLELKVPEENAEPKVAVEADSMARWHEDYSAKIVPFKKALSGVLKVQANSRTLIMLQACQELSRVAAGVMADSTALKSPDPVVGDRLRDALIHFKQAADSCIGNRLMRTREHISEGEQSLGQALKALQTYGLSL